MKLEKKELMQRLLEADHRHRELNKAREIMTEIELLEAILYEQKWSTFLLIIIAVFTVCIWYRKK